MKRLKLVLLLCLGIVALLAILPKAMYYYYSYRSLNPEFFADEIDAFDALDEESPPAAGSILFVGSSSFRFWDSLAEDMAPLPIINRGFGGSMVHHASYFAERIVCAYQPSIVALYAGDNDIGNLVKQRSAEQVIRDFDEFLGIVRECVGNVPVAYVAIKPSLLRWDDWPAMDEVNHAIAARANEDALIYFLDIATPMLGADKKPREDLFKADGLHINAEGYQLWTSVIKPVLRSVYANTQSQQ